MTWTLCNRPGKRHKKPVDLHADLHGSAESGARTWTRTKDPQINRRLPLRRKSAACGTSIYTKLQIDPRRHAGCRIHLHGNCPGVGAPCLLTSGALELYNPARL